MHYNTDKSEVSDYNYTLSTYSKENTEFDAAAYKILQKSIFLFRFLLSK